MMLLGIISLMEKNNKKIVVTLLILSNIVLRPVSAKKSLSTFCTYVPIFSLRL